MNETNIAVEFALKDCRIHYGPVGGKCHKCTYVNSDQHQDLLRKGLQRDGTPFSILIGEIVPSTIQGRQS